MHGLSCLALRWLIVGSMQTASAAAAPAHTHTNLLHSRIAPQCFLNYINVQQAANTARWNIELSNGTTTRKWLLQANW